MARIANPIVDWAKITQNDLGKMSGIPSTTFSRSVKARFSAEQSERLVRIIRVIDRAVELFDGDKEEAQKWLNEPNRTKLESTGRTDGIRNGGLRGY